MLKENAVMFDMLTAGDLGTHDNGFTQACDLPDKYAYL